MPELPDKRHFSGGSDGEERRGLPPTPPAPSNLSLRHKFGTAPGGGASWLRQAGGVTPRGDGADTFRIGTALGEGGSTPVGTSRGLEGAVLLPDITPSAPALQPLSARSLTSARGGDAAAVAGSNRQVTRWASATAIAGSAAGPVQAALLLATPTQAAASTLTTSSSSAIGQQQPASVPAAARRSGMLAKLRPSLPAVFKRGSGK